MLTTLLETAPNTVLGNIIVVSGAFIILLILVRKFAWGAITGIFEERANKINNDITTAELSKKEAETLLAQRENELAGSKEEAANMPMIQLNKIVQISWQQPMKKLRM